MMLPFDQSFDPEPPRSAILCSICRCGSPEEHARRAERAAAESVASTRQEHDKKVAGMQAELDKLRQSMRTDDYQIVRVEEVGRYLVLSVKYPTCQHREFEGVKTMVFRNVDAKRALTWTQIDPHFRNPGGTQLITAAPPPVARFPGGDEGWQDALAYARAKS